MLLNRSLRIAHRILRGWFVLAMASFSRVSESLTLNPCLGRNVNREELRRRQRTVNDTGLGSRIELKIMVVLRCQSGQISWTVFFFFRMVFVSVG